MRSLRGVPAAPGIVSGPWLRIDRPELEGGRVASEAQASEIEHLRDACQAAARDLDLLAERVEADGHADEAAIFLAQASIARDPALLTMARGRVEELSEDGVAAIQGAGRAFAEQLRSLDDELLAARAEDVVDVAGRIAGLLAGSSAGPEATLDQPSIVVARDLPPSITATLPRERLLGIALEGSSPTAHAAILARAYGIPAVVGVADLLRHLAANGARAGTVALDGATGEVVIDPDAAASARFEAGERAEARRRRADLESASLPARTEDGVEISLLANIGASGESSAALALGARGVGLFRTEFLFLERSAPPSEDEQVAAYAEAIRAFRPHPVTIRLLDVGGDKQIPYLPIEPEANPFLGVRSLRMAHEAPELFVTQLRALYRAAAEGPLKVMAPMIADAPDADLLIGLAERARSELAAEGQVIGEVSLGAMLEIPSAILVADSYFGRIAFASLGTNDLLQYALAADRGNARLDRYRDALHPALLRLVELAVTAGKRAGIEVSVCGEMAGDPAAALALIGLGIRSLSMASTSLPAVRRAIRAARADAIEATAGAALDDASAKAVRARFEALLVAGPVRPASALPAPTPGG